MEIQHLPLNKISPSPKNPRKTFDETALAELADNIEKQGLLQPITVRPVRNHSEDCQFDTPDSYEIVMGERRYRAKKILQEKWKDFPFPNGTKYDEIACIVREMSDEEAFEAMITENLQRKDVDPMEEGYAFEQLVKNGKTVEELSARFGKNVRFINERIKLTALIPELKQEVSDARMPIVTALMICKLSEKDQRKYYNDNKDYSNPYSKNSAQNFIDRMMMNINNSLWKDEPDYDGGCGRKCSECPNCTVNHGCLFYEMKPEGLGRCTSQEMFDKKGHEYVRDYLLKDINRYVRKGDSFGFGKTVIGVEELSWDNDSVKAEKKEIKEMISGMGLEVVNPSSQFLSRCYYEADDERTIEKLESGEIYRVLNLFHYSTLQLNVEHWYLKKEATPTEASKDGLPVDVSVKIRQLKNSRDSLQTEILTETAKLISKEAKAEKKPLNDIERKLFCILMLGTNFKLRDEYNNPVGYRDDVYNTYLENPDVFTQCIRAWLQDHLTLGHNAELNLAEPMLDEIGTLWLGKKYTDLKEKKAEKQKKQEEKLLNELAELGYTEDGKRIRKPEKAEKTRLERYDEMKKKHPDSICLFRVGDFYETINEDAEKVAECLGLVTTNLTEGNQTIIVSGFPHEAINEYLPKIIRSGMRISINDKD